MKFSGLFYTGAVGLILPNLSNLQVRCQSWLPNCSQQQDRQVSSEDALSSQFEIPFSALLLIWMVEKGHSYALGHRFTVPVPLHLVSLRQRWNLTPACGQAQG